LDEGELGAAQVFKVLREASASSPPPEGALYDPAFRQNDEAFCQIRALDDFEIDFAGIDTPSIKPKVSTMA
jgi:hypothetical protein